MRSSADDLMCSRLFGLALLAWRSRWSSTPEPRVPPLGSFVVVVDSRIHPRDSVGYLVRYRPAVTKGRNRCVERFTIQTPRGVEVLWTNCVLFRAPDGPGDRPGDREEP